jgi:hypothetical protein
MDRRRFVPSPEGLEGRSMMSILNPITATPPAVQNLPNTYKQKITRIDRLPVFLRSYQPDRFLPESATAPLQADLIAIQSRLHPASSVVLDKFNRAIRDVIPHLTLSTASALKADMNTLARIDSQDINPIILATNDYSIVAQTALGVGLPIRTPDAPSLAPADTVGATGSHVTRNPQPHLVGTYEPGSTIQILGTDGAVLGSAVVTKSGKYSVQFNAPLSLGRHVIRVQAVDTGDVSPPSRQYAFRVIARPTRVAVQVAHPQGPQGSSHR